MKILYPFDNPEKALNPYVLTIVQGLKKNSSDLEIVCSIAEFWTTNDIFDIVHIMWPDMLLKEHFRKNIVLKIYMIDCVGLLVKVAKLYLHVIIFCPIIIVMKIIERLMRLFIPTAS